MPIVSQLETQMWHTFSLIFYDLKILKHLKQMQIKRKSPKHAFHII